LGLFKTLRLLVIALFYALLVFYCFFVGLSAFGLVGPDEPRYASIAREMERSGDWVTPRLNGQPWFEKPPLYYWSAAIGFRLLASPEAAARAPSGVYALFAVLGIFLLARRFYGPAVASAAGWILPATVAMTGFAHAAAPDMPFAVCLTLAMVAAGFLLLEERSRNTQLCAAAFGAALGLAVLAKGPAAILLAGGSTALWAVATGHIRRAWRLCHPVAIAAFTVVAVPWYTLCAARHPEFPRIFLLEHNVERFLTNRYQHQQPFWFFVPILLIAVLPWTLLLIPSIRDGWRAVRGVDWRKSPGVFLAAWVVFPLVFFSASQSKLPGYILPAVPPLALLLAHALAGNEATAGSAPRWGLLWPSAALIVGGLLPIFGPAIVTRVRPPLRSVDAQGMNQMLLVLGSVLFLGGLAVAVAGLLRKPVLGAAIAASVFAFCAGLAANHVVSSMSPDISARELAFVARDRAAGAAIAVYDLPRAWQFGCEFYLERSLPEWTPQMPRPGWVITTPEGSAVLERQGLHLEPMGQASRRAALFRAE